jgi:hypothetical protein
LNLINYAIQSQEMFNKMGRYYIKYEEVLNMYMQLLEDIEMFNSFLKISAKEIIEKNSKIKLSLSMDNDHFLGLNSLQMSDIRCPNNNKNFSDSKKDKLITSSTNVESSTIVIPSN